MSRTGIYVRVSTDRQEHRSQLASLFVWLNEQGLGRGDCRWYRDRGVSSALLSRPAFDRMMADVHDGLLDRIVVYDMDRIGRWDVDDFLLWRISLKRRGVELISLAGDANPFESLADRLLALCLADADRRWLEGHRRRVRDGVRASAAYKNGKWGGARTVQPGRRGCRRFTDKQVAEIKESLLLGTRPSEVARIVGCHANTIRKIRRRMEANK